MIKAYDPMDTQVRYKSKYYYVTSRNAVYSKNKSSKRCYVRRDSALYRAIIQQLQFDSPNGFNTKVWGPCMWTFLHTMAFNYPLHPTPQKQQQYFQFIQCLGNVLPCGTCRDNYNKNLRELGFSKKKHLKNRETLGKFMYDLHTHINTLTRGSFNVPYNLLRTNFELFRAACTPEKQVTEEHKGCISKKCKLKISIVPHDSTGKTFTIDKKCITDRH